MSAVTKISTVVDSSTGEVVDESVEQVSYEKQENYFKTFTSDLASIHGTTHAGKKVLFEILMSEMKRNGEVVIGIHQKRAMAKRIGFSHTKTVDSALADLIKKNVLVRVGRGTFMMNPNLFAKGTPAEIKHARIEYCKLTVIYSEKGRSITAEIGEAK